MAQSLWYQNTNFYNSWHFSKKMSHALPLWLKLYPIELHQKSKYLMPIGFTCLLLFLSFVSLKIFPMSLSLAHFELFPQRLSFCSFWALSVILILSSYAKPSQSQTGITKSETFQFGLPQTFQAGLPQTILYLVFFLFFFLFFYCSFPFSIVVLFFLSLKSFYWLSLQNLPHCGLNKQKQQY